MAVAHKYGKWKINGNSIVICTYTVESLHLIIQNAKEGIFHIIIYRNFVSKPNLITMKYLE